MTTDQFNNITKPIYGESTEIGQSTFVELISVNQKTIIPAIKNNNPNVNISLKELAFGKTSKSETIDPASTPSVFTAIPTTSALSSQNEASKYSLKNDNNENKIAKLEMAKSSVEFRDLISNPTAQTISSLSADNCQLCENPCLYGPEDICPVDLAIVFDSAYDEIPEGPKLLSIKSEIIRTIDLLRSIVGENFRLSLNTFGHNNRGFSLPFSGLCGQASYDAFMSVFNQVLNLNPGHIEDEDLAFYHDEKIVIDSDGKPHTHTAVFWVPESSAFSVKETAESTDNNIRIGCWREGSIRKVILLITNSASRTDAPYPNPTVTQAATAAADCNVKVVYVGAPGIIEEGDIYTSITGGTNVLLDYPISPHISHNDSGMSHLESNPVVSLDVLLTPFMQSLCEEIMPPECDGGTNKILNGTFNGNISSWNIISGDANWDAIFNTTTPSDPIGFGSLKLSDNSGTAIVEQEITGLNPEDYLLFYASWCVNGADGTKLIGELIDSYNNTIATISSSGNIGTTLPDSTNGCSQERQTRAPIKIIVPPDGIIKARFTLTGSGGNSAYIDQVIVCQLVNDNCGPGARNNVNNPNFKEGVEFWDDSTNIALTPFTDTNVWDSSVLAIIVNTVEKNEVRQTLTELTPDSILTLNFELLSYTSNNGEFNPKLELIYGALESDNSIIISESITNATTPIELSINFVVPSDGIVRIFFKNGVIGGIAKIRNISVCSSTGICEAGFEKISFDDFAADKNGWLGGIYDMSNKQILITPNTQIQKTYPGLISGDNFQLSVNIKNSGGIVITLISGSAASQIVIQATPGYYTLEITTQDSGMVVARIQTIDSFINVDDILACQKISGSCDGSISNVQAIIEWQGTPRRPINFFNMIVRYTVRDPSDPFNIIEYTFLPDNEGRLGIGTCEFWKSQIGPTTTILRSDLNQSFIGDIENGDFNSVAPKINWLWSIPSPQNTGFSQDNLIINFPDPTDEQLIESVKFLFLTNEIIQKTGTDTPPVNPTTDCSTDPAVEFDIILRFTNSIGFSREFRSFVAQNTLWNQSVDFGSNPNPWDTNSSTGDGLKGSSARWEEVDFILDTVDGRGLDQCTVPLFFTTDSVGSDLVFKEFELKGTGIFIDSCNSEIIIDDMSVGNVINEIQSITLPTSNGGSWSLSFTFNGTTENIDIPFNATNDQLRTKLGSLSNIGGIDNISVVDDGTALNPFLITFQGNLSGVDHDLLVADGANLIGAASATVATETDGTVNERQRITNTIDSHQDLIVSYAGDSSVPIVYNSSLNIVQSSIEGIGNIGVGNVSVIGNTTDRDANYAGPYIIDFIGSLANANILQITAEPDAYVVTTDWSGGIGNGQNEKQLIGVNAYGGTFTLRVFNIGSNASPIINVSTTQNGGASEDSDCYDIEFGGIFAGDNIDVNTFFGGFFSGTNITFSHSQQNIRTGNGSGTTFPITEIQRHCFQWLPDANGSFATNSQFSLVSPSDAIFAPIVGTVASDLLTRGVNNSNIIETYLQQATGAGASTESDIKVTNFSLFGSADEIQIVTIKNNPTGGTFTLNIEGKTTAPIVFDASEIDVQNALRSLSNLSEVTVTKSGSLPNDVVYTVTFEGADGNRNWQEIIPNTTNLTSDAEYANTAQIVFNATPDIIENALITAAGFLTTSDISVSQIISDITNGFYAWEVEFIGSFATQNVAQMQTTADWLTGAVIKVQEIQPGGGVDDSQRITVINATSGYFYLTVTINSIDYKTTAIPWNTGPLGVQAQLLALSPFSTGDITVVNTPKSDANQQRRFIVTFDKKFGNIPLMVPDFEITLFCDPIILPYVPPGPYKYLVPECDSFDEDLSCQSGPLLCVPGVGDTELIESMSCCDENNITLDANVSTQLNFQRDLFDPNSILTPGGINGKRFTIRELAVLKGLNPVEYAPYARNFNTQQFVPISFSTQITTKMSIILIENELDTKRGRQRIAEHLQNHREILPSRFVWPDCDITTQCWPGIGEN